MASSDSPVADRLDGPHRGGRRPSPDRRRAPRLPARSTTGIRRIVRLDRIRPRLEYTTMPASTDRPIACSPSPIFASPHPSASAATPSLTAIRPVGGQRGTEIEVTLSGARLGDAKEILFYQPGITTVTKLDQGRRQQRQGDAQDRPRLPARPARPPAPHGDRDQRAADVQRRRPARRSTRSSRTTTSPSPQPIAMNVTVNGVADNEDVDYFVVEAKKGERITAEVEGIRLGITLFDPYVAILDAKRFELASSDDAALIWQDGVRLGRRPRGRHVHHPGPRERLRGQRRVPLPAPRRQLPPADGRRSRPAASSARRSRSAGSATSLGEKTTERHPARPTLDRDFGLVAPGRQGDRPLPERVPAHARSAT